MTTPRHRIKVKHTIRGSKCETCGKRVTYVKSTHSYKHARPKIGQTPLGWFPGREP